MASVFSLMQKIEILIIYIKKGYKEINITANNSIKQ